MKNLGKYGVFALIFGVVAIVATGWFSYNSESGVTEPSVSETVVSPTTQSVDSVVESFKENAEDKTSNDLKKTQAKEATPEEATEANVEKNTSASEKGEESPANTEEEPSVSAPEPAPTH